MKQNQKRIITAVVILISFWFILNWTGLFRYYKISSSANEPNYYPGDWIYVSSFSEPDLLDMVCFENDKEQITTFRLCGKSDDKVEIRNGILFVNGKNKDASLNLKKLYHVNQSDYDKLPALDYAYETVLIDSSENFVLLETATQKNITSAQIADPYKTSGKLHRSFPVAWTMINFGPVKVPKGKVFLLGDHRSFAIDSRFIGFIDEDAIVGTILN